METTAGGLLSRKVNMTRSHDKESYAFNAITDVLTIRKYIEKSANEKALIMIENLFKVTVRQLYTMNVYDWFPVVSDILSDDPDIKNMKIDDESLAVIISYAALYQLDKKNEWHLLYILAIIGSLYDNA